MQNMITSIFKWSHLNNFGLIKVLLGKAVAQTGTNLEDFLQLPTSWLNSRQPPFWLWVLTSILLFILREFAIVIFFNEL